MEKGKFPSCILIFSGKRKSGKDYVTDKLAESYRPEEIAIVKISAPIKSHFANKYNMNFNELMTDSAYKETCRKEMILWGEEMRMKDPGSLCKAAIEMYDGYSKPIWIVSDARRKTDVKWFRETFGDVVKTIRVVASNEARVARGWKFAAGVDDGPSECDLDDYTEWDWKIENSGDVVKLNESLREISQYMKKFV